MGISLDFRVETFTKSEMSEKQSPEWHPESQTPRIQAGSSVSRLGVDEVLMIFRWMTKTMGFFHWVKMRDEQPVF